MRQLQWVDVETATEGGTAVTGDVSTNDSDIDDGSTAVFTLDAAVDGLTLNTDGSFNFDPTDAAYDHIEDGVTLPVIANYTMTDEHGATSSSTLTISVLGTNDAPVAVVDVETATEGGTAVTGDVSTNDSDIDDGSTAVFTLDAAVDGLTLNTDGTYSFDPTDVAYDHIAMGATQIVVADYTMTDEHGATAMSTLTITVTGTNDAPVAVADSFAVNESSLGIFNVLTNGVADSDVDDGSSFSVTSLVDIDDDPTGTTNGFATPLSGTPSSAVSPSTAGTITTDYGAVVTLQSDGQLIYDLTSPSADFNQLADGETATDTFSYTITDEHGATDTAQVTVTLTGVNDVVIAVDDTIAATENGSGLTGDLTSNDTDVDIGDSKTVTSVIAGTGTTVTPTFGGGFTIALGSGVSILLSSDGTYTVDAETAAAGEVQTGEFSYTIQDDGGTTSTATVNVAITGVNDAPVATALTGAASEDGPAVTVTANFTDIDTIDTHTFSVDQSATLGSVTNNNDGTFDYDANGAFESLAAGETTDDTFTYTVDDGNGGTDTETVTITITGVNDGPVAAAVAAGASEDGPVITVAASFTDVDATDAHSFTVNDAGTLGAVTNNMDGTFEYDATGAFESLAEGAMTIDTFTYTVDDGNGGTATETVTVTITGVNDAAIISGTTIGTADEDGAVSITGMLAAADVDNTDDVFQMGAGSATFGTWAIDAAGAWSYSLDNGNPAVDALNVGDNLSDTFAVMSQDGTLQTISITITGTNDDAIISGDNTGAVVEDSGISTTGLLTSADVDNVDNSFNAEGGAATYGTWAIDAVGAWTYTLDDSNAVVNALNHLATLTDSFDVESEDGTVQTISINITGANDAPVITGDVVGSVTEETTLSATGTIIVTDVDTGESFATAQVDTAGSHGLFSVNGLGVWDYQLNNADTDVQELGDGEVLTETFTVVSADGFSSQIVTITINGTNDAPVVTAVSAAANEDGPAVTVTASFTDVDANDTHTFSVDQSATLGSVTNNNDGTFDYDATGAFESLAVGEFASDTFTYTVEDGNGGSATETVTVNITGLNDGPVAAAVAAGASEDGPVITVAASFTDVDATDGHSFTVDDSGTLGAVTNNMDGTFDYDPNGAFDTLANGATTIDTFTYTVDDGNGGTSTETVTVSITGTNDDPVAVADIAAATEDGAVVMGDVSINDSDVDVASMATFTLNAAVAGLTLNANGTYSFDPTDAAYDHIADGATEDVVANYTMTDEHGGTATSTLTITITGTNDAPIVTGLSTNTVDEFATNGTVVGTVTATDAELGSTLTYVLTDDADGRFAIDGATGEVTVIDGLALDFEQEISHDITVEVSDGIDTTTQTLAIDVTDIVSPEIVNLDDAGRTVYGDDGDDQLTGGAGNDKLYGQSGADILIGGAGDDRIYSGSGNDTVTAGDGDDYVRAGGGVESFDGGAGNDYISYYSSTNGVTVDLAANTASGSWASNDTINSFESISGSKNGDDRITGTAGENTIRTYGGDDRIYSGDGNDIVQAGDGDDYVRVADGANSFDGGAGDDYISYYDSADGVIVDLAANTASGGLADDDTINSFEGISGSKLGDDEITGTSGANTIRTYGGKDRIFSGDGDDEVFAGDGNDYVRAANGTNTYDGGAGTDRISYYDSAVGVDVNLETNVVSGGLADGDTISNFENLSGSRLGDDEITGTSGANKIKTYGGDDRVYSGDGDDIVETGDGDDYVRVANGANTFDGGDGDDYISFYDSVDGVTLNLETNTASGGLADDDTINNFESVSGSKLGDDDITGTSGANTIRTYGGDDRIISGDGDDVVQAGDGDDYVRAGDGANNFDGGVGTDDYISYYDSVDGVTLNLGTNVTSGGFAADDTISNFESAGGSKTGNDDITGSSGDNRIKTYGGDDVLNGLQGDDKLYGGTGADTFHFGLNGDNDVIKDFEDDVDNIVFDNFVFGAGDAFDFASQVGSDVVFDFGGGDTLTVEDITIADLTDDVI